MKKFLFVALLFTSCATPYQIVETITKDSTGKEIRTITKKFDNTTVVPQASFNMVGSPLWYGYGSYYSMPYYNYSPRVIVPIRPSYNMPRGRRH